MSHALFIERVRPESVSVLALLLCASEEARTLYPELHFLTRSLADNREFTDDTVYLVGWEREWVVACGALAPMENDAVEMRRIFVAPEHRRRGYARRIVAALIAYARATRRSCIYLEVGPCHQAVVRLYEQVGFKPIAPFGRHVGKTDSTCYELRLG